MNIWEVLQSLQSWSGISANREWWNGHHRIYLQVPTEQSKMTKPYIYMETEQWDIIPWVCSQTDLLSNDWEIVVSNVL
jgi:hypothetical protein